MIDKITPVIMVKDGAKTIARCLNSLEHFKEVVIYLNNTTDNTKEICASFANVKLVEGEFTNYSDTRNRAAEYASSDWIIIIDSDEWLDQDAVIGLGDWNTARIDFIGDLMWHNHFMGKKLRFGPFRPKRKKYFLYNRKAFHFEKAVHEVLVGDLAPPHPHIVDRLPPSSTSSYGT